MARNKTVALALGGGGARGYAHIGVLQVLAEANLEVTHIAGTSMGAIVGALHAADAVDDFVDWVSGIRRQRDMLRYFQTNIGGASPVRINKVLDRVDELIGVQRIDELPIPFTAVATDLWARREVWFHRGPIGPALRASIAIPGIFPPILLNGRLLVDGGVLNQVPVSALAASPADYAISVSLDGLPRLSHGESRPVHASTEDDPVEHKNNRLQRSMNSLWDSDLLRPLTQRISHRTSDAVETLDALDPAHADSPAALLGTEHTGSAPDSPGPDAALGSDVLYEALPAGMRTTDVLRQSLDTMQSVMARFQTASFPVDVDIEIPRDSCGVMDFHRVHDMIELGRSKAAAALEAVGLLGDHLPAPTPGEIAPPPA